MTILLSSTFGKFIPFSFLGIVPFPFHLLLTLQRIIRDLPDAGMLTSFETLRSAVESHRVKALSQETLWIVTSFIIACLATRQVNRNNRIEPYDDTEGTAIAIFTF